MKVTTIYSISFQTTYFSMPTTDYAATPNFTIVATHWCDAPVSGPADYISRSLHKAFEIAAAYFLHTGHLLMINYLFFSNKQHQSTVI